MAEAREEISLSPAAAWLSPRPCQIMRGRGVWKSSSRVVGAARVVRLRARTDARRDGSWNMMIPL